MIRLRAWPLLLVILPFMAAAGMGQEAAQPEKLVSGWRREVKVSESGDLVTAWVEKGWLQVRRQNAAGEVDWQIVLARATNPTPPTIENWPLAGSVNLGYQEGRYFIREFQSYLRVVREKKEASDDDWPRLTLNLDTYKSSGWAQGSSRWVTTWRGKPWFAVTLGPDKEASDCFIRLNHLDLTDAGFGVQSTRDFVRAFHGETEVFDDSDLLFCKRMTEAAAKGELAHRAIKSKLVGSPAPTIDGTQWRNTPGPLSWQELRGKVVLLDFWGTWCTPCVKKLPHTEELYQKYKDRGLVVIGVHSQNGADSVASFLEEHKIHFPIVVDSGQTAERYAIEAWPTYFLIDRQGRVAWGFENDAPAEERIESLLGKQ